MHRLSWDNAWSFQLDSLALVRVDWAFAVDWVTEGVDDSSQDLVTDGDIDNGSRSLDDITFLDFSAHERDVRRAELRTKSCTTATPTYLSLPRMTIPTLSVSRLRAIPRTPDLNSTISPAWTLVRPKTLAIPSPMEMTDPNSFKSFYRIRKLINGQNGYGRSSYLAPCGCAPNRTRLFSNKTYHLVDS